MREHMAKRNRVAHLRIPKTLLIEPDMRPTMETHLGETIPVPGLAEVFQTLVNETREQKLTEVQIFQWLVQKYPQLYTPWLAMTYLGKTGMFSLGKIPSMINKGIESLVNIFRTYEILDKQQKEMWVPLVDIHCPHVPGCSASFAFERTTQIEKQFKVQVMFLGVGSGFEQCMSFTWTTPTKEECREIWVPVEVEILRCQASSIFSREKVMFQQINALRLLSGFQPIKLESGEDNCPIITETTPGGWEKAHFPLSKLKQRQIHKIKKEITVGDRWEFRMDLPKSLSDYINAGVIISAESLVSGTYNYELLEGWDYIGYLDSTRSAGYFWNWT